MAGATPPPVRYADWRAQVETLTDLIAPGPAQRLRATLDAGPDPVVADALPPLWHWLYFLPAVPMAGIGADGHPRRGGFMPPVSLPRRMFAGTRVELHAPLRIGAAAERVAEVVAIDEKHRAGDPLVFVTVRFRISQHGSLCVEEHQSIVYRAAGERVPLPATRPFAPPPAGALARTVVIDPVMLFRFSALTFNGHRIHYDRAYARDVEGYPALVVHAPFTAILLAAMCAGDAGRTLRRFELRARAPLFDSAPLQLLVTAAATGLVLEARRCDGVVAMSGTAA
ncbi:MAG: acyl-CoA dehydrogenase [Gammaproteobacteria bacterium]|nr:acyl-CoA dehydrogenase [Gammaproteobacteria bacterium]